MGVVKYTGPVASFHCPTNAEIRSLKVHFSPKQEGTGDPSPENIRPIVGWDGVEVEQSNDNLFNENSITYSRWTDASGNVNTRAKYGCISEKIRTNSTSFTLIAMAERPNSMSIIEYDANGNFLRRTHGNQVQYVKVNATWSSTAYIAVQISDSNGGTTITPEYISQRNMMLVEGTDDPLAYKPHQGFTTNYEFGVLGKNKCPLTTLGNAEILELGGKQTDNSTMRLTIENLVPSSDYTLSCLVTSQFSASTQDRLYLRGETEGFINLDSYPQTRQSITKKSKADGTIDITINVAFSKDENRVAEVTDIQLELGSTATTYEPYDPKHTVYGGWVDLISGEVCEEYIAKDMGQINWVKSSSGNKFYIIGLSSNYPMRPDLIMYCPIYKFDGPNVGGSWYGDDCTIRYYYAGGGSSREIYVHDERYDNAQDFKAAMNGINLIYPLATPNTYSLAPTQLQTFLGQNNIWSNADYVEVEYDLHETQNILARKQFIMANQPHVVTPAAAPLQNFVTDMAAPLKSCKVYFNPVQEGSGDPSPENVRAISGWNGCEVYQTKTNLFPEVMLANFENYATKGNYGYWYTNPIYLTPNTVYHLDWTRKTSDSDPLCLWGIKTYSGMDYGVTDAGTFQYYCNGANGFRSYTSFNSGPTGIIRFALNKQSSQYSTAQDALDDLFAKATFMLTVGTTAIPYEPYSGTTLSIDWTTEAGTVYGGYVDLVKGEVVQTHYSITLDGINVAANRGYIDGTRYGGGFVYMSHYGAPNSIVSYTYKHIYCDSLPVREYNVIHQKELYFPYAGALYFIVYMGEKDASTTITNAEAMNECNAWLQEHPLHVVYELETPIHYPLTTETLKTLRGTNNIWANNNDGNLEVAYWRH